MDSLDFSDILASSVHDIKNSLGLILTNLDDLIANPDNRIANPSQANVLQHEVRRANGSLIQLLTLYKLGQQQLSVRISDNNVSEFFNELIAENLSVCRSLNLEVLAVCDPDLEGYFDTELIRSVLDSTIGNARRYARRQIQLNAECQAEYLVLRVEDDGPGFPDYLTTLRDYRPSALREKSDATHTQLGLYFAARIAQLHRHGEHSGRIQLHNAHQLSGGCFELWLP
ncbi:hypothetical protein SAMN05421644_11014 [Allochromatium warmingii]|uniref:histidine kinase n=1 Tax=Allochromatium warmingii TaxID=61595 RepID=A0A1H3DUA3_ALLWA|nr:HAMP domain-containing sensor histidine kinase [Allochromatium warmingii]SDX69985.1 hypothetical protein SAMN05421644_11014 [Allochromatium warmingii]